MNLGFRIYKALGMSRTPQEGAKTTINCAVYPELAGVSGAYYIDCRSTQPSQLARLVLHDIACRMKQQACMGTFSIAYRKIVFT